MQKISRKIYNELFHHGANVLNEEEFDLDEFTKIEGYKSQKAYLFKLAKAGILKYIDEGSARMAYVMKDGKCLKVARVNGGDEDYTRGIEQNRAEVKNSQIGEKYGCFPSIYDYDKKNYTCLVTECCAETHFEDWTKLYKIPLTDIMAMFGLYLGYDHRDPMTLKEICDQFRTINKNSASEEDVQEWLNEYNNVERLNSHRIFHYIEFLEKMQRSTEPKYKALQQVLKFWDDNGPDSMAIDDLCLTANWGLRNIDGHDVPVVIDSGMSQEVLAAFYDTNEGFA